MTHIKTYPIENSEELANILKNHNFQPSWTRLNVVENHEFRYLSNGRKVLPIDKPVLSEVKKKGPLFRAVVKHQPW